MTLTPLARALCEEIERIPVIDGHEHLSPERARTSRPADVFTLFSSYVSGDLSVAGMPDVGLLWRQEVPLEERWRAVEPYWSQVRHSGYARALLLAVKRFYGFDDISEQTYRPLSEAMAAANTPGLYTRVLREACGIETALVQQVPVWDPENADRPLLTPVVWRVPIDTRNWLTLTETKLLGATQPIASLDAYLEALNDWFVRMKAQGHVAIKVFARPFGTPDRARAEAAFRDLRLQRAEALPPCDPLFSFDLLPSAPLYDFLLDECVRLAGEHELTVAVHTGYWGDFRRVDPLHMIPMIMRHPGVRFDVYHLGYPWVRETLMLGKGFANVWLNLCWTHAISPTMAMAAIEEAIDLLPMNKLTAFGGDYHIAVEKVYGHLTMAREHVAAVLARRVEAGDFDAPEALRLARQWFYENPKALYRLP